MMSTKRNLKLDIQLFDLIWSNATDVIFTIGHDGSIIDANPVFEVLIGWNIEELKGLSFPPFFSHITHQELLKHM